MLHSRQPHTWRRLLCLLSLVALAAGHQDHGRALQRPDWLIGLQQLLQQQAVPPSVSAMASTQSYHKQPPTAAGASNHGTLLRPKTLPAVAAAHVAGVQPAGGASSSSVTLASVARSYGITQSQLQRMMEQDQGLLVSNHGLLVWACGSGHHSHAHDADRPVGMSAGNKGADGTGWQEEGVEPAAEVGVDVSVKASVFAAPDNTGMEWLASGLFTAVLGPDLAHADAADSTANPQAGSWTSVTSATLQTTSSSQLTLAGPPLTAAEGTSAVVQQPGPLPPLEQAFKLHNRPPGSVPHTIFLDFRGCSITSSYWNTATSKPVLITQPYDLDGDPSTVSVQEQQAVVSIWQAVAQDFAPWAVDVTTEDPGLDALVK